MPQPTTQTAPDLSGASLNLQPQGMPMSTSPVTPTPQLQSPTAPAAAPTTPQSGVTVNVNPAAEQTAQAGQPTTQTSGANKDVQNLQDYLVHMGYMTPEQVSTGYGTYGPQTTAAVASMQSKLGLNPATNTPTKTDLSQKYQGVYNAVKDTAAPQNGADASATTQPMMGSDTSSQKDPVMGSYIDAMQPIMKSLTQVMNNINNPALTAVSLQQEYDTLREKGNLPAMQSQMLNMQNIMNGTINDVREEITKTGGLATESQVQGIASARNTVLLKQYNALSSQYTAAQNNVDNMMKYATQDQATQLQRAQASASVTESMASISNQMMTMGMTMQKNARDAAQYNVTQMGYKGLAASTQGNPQLQSYYEGILGLQPGSLSDPKQLAAMDTYKDQQLLINQYKAQIQGYNAGYGGGFPGTGNQPAPDAPGGQPVGQVGVNPVDPTTLIRPPSVKDGVPLSMSAEDMQTYMSKYKAANIDPGTNNVVAPGIGYYLHQSDGSYVLKSALPSDTQTQYNDIQKTIASSQPESLSPTVTRKWSLTANAAITSFKNTGTYQVISNVAPYIANIRAAAANPGDKSVSDLELLDSYIRLSKGGVGQITGDQVDILLKGSSLGDKASVLQQKLNSGGSLSGAQRKALIDLSEGVYKENAADYQKIYVQAIHNMKQQGVPVQFWGNLPDFTGIMSQPKQ